MPGKLLTLNSKILCPHGGRVQLVTTDSSSYAEKALVLLETDIHTVVSCPHYRGDTYSPCVRVEWSAGASRVKVRGTPVLIISSIGKCYNNQGALQGIAQIVTTQKKANVP